ncbi:MAG: hypothetical protein BWZ03_00083 [bacterium ADurb.BinA186]|nr:MAG: hypothetical protein BWZ03_00083 [bacterium ADurb.BinA186]
MEYLTILAQMLIDKLPVIGIITANGVVLVTGVGVLIEIVEVIAKLTPSQKDDEIVSKAKKIRDKVVPILELIPHVNLPVAPVILKAISLLGKFLKFIKGGSEALEKKE